MLFVLTSLWMLFLILYWFWLVRPQDGFPRGLVHLLRDGGGFSLLFSLHSRDLTKTAGCSDELCSLTEVSVSLCWDFSESLNYAAKDDEISILCSFILFLIKHVDHQEWDFHHESLGSRLANTAGRNCRCWCCWPKREEAERGMAC